MQWTYLWNVLLAIRNTIFDVARHSGGVINRNGTINPNSLERFRMKHREQLNALTVPDPETNQMVPMMNLLENTQNLVADMLARQVIQRQRIMEIEGAQLYRSIQNRVGKQGNPNAVIDDALNNKLAMKDLAASVSDNPLQQIAFRRMLFHRLLENSFSSKTGAISNPQQFRGLLADKEEILVEGLGREHYENLVLLSDAYERVLATGISEGKGLDRNTLVDKFGQITGVTPQGYSARMINMLEGRVSPRTTFVWLASQAARAGQMRSLDAAFEEAMFNPNFAKMLMEQTPDVAVLAPAAARRVRPMLWAAGILDPSQERSMREVTIPLDPAPQLPVDGAQASLPVPVPVQTAPTRPETGSQGGIAAVAPNISQAANSELPYEVLFPNDPLGAEISQRNR